MYKITIMIPYNKVEVKVKRIKLLWTFYNTTKIIEKKINKT